MKNNEVQKTLTMRSTVRTLSIKCYEEQMPEGWTEVQKKVEGIDKKDFQVLAIRHDRDPKADDIWGDSTEKAHYHIILRVTGKNPTRVSTILNMLNIAYRPDKDETLWKQHGVETVGDFSNMAVYLTHETEQAILDGKERYELTELVSNLNMDEIKQVREGYVRLSQIGKVSVEDMARLDEAARDLGYELKDFNEWYFSLPFEMRANSKIRTVKESYYEGVRRRVEKDNTVNRLCIFIEGDKNVGKTYTSRKALEGQKVLSVGGGGTGKFDELSPSTEAIILDDDGSTSILNMTDNYICQAYRRQSNNPYWCGKTFIVTSNNNFRDWVESCGIGTEEIKSSRPGVAVDTEEYKAIRSRFYICHIENVKGINKLVCDSPSRRGTASEQADRYTRFMDFKEKFNKELENYVPKNNTFDYSNLNK